MEMNARNIGVVDLSLRSPQRFKNSKGSLLSGFADRSLGNDLPDLLQPSLMGMGMPMTVLMLFMRVLMLIVMRMAMSFTGVVLVFVSVIMMVVVTVLLQKFFARKLLLPANQDIELNRADAAALHPRYFQAGLHAQCRYRPGEQLRRHAGIQQRAQKHIAADPGEAL